MQRRRPTGSQAGPPSRRVRAEVSGQVWKGPALGTGRARVMGFPGLD